MIYIYIYNIMAGAHTGAAGSNSWRKADTKCFDPLARYATKQVRRTSMTRSPYLRWDIHNIDFCFLPSPTMWKIRMSFSTESESLPMWLTKGSSGRFANFCIQTSPIKFSQCASYNGCLLLIRVRLCV